MQRKYSRIGFILSSVIHGMLFVGIWYLINIPVKVDSEEPQALSLEIMTALLEQPAVASAPEITTEDVVEEEQVETPEPEPEEPEPVIEPPKPIEKPKPKPKEPPKKDPPKKVEKPKEKKEKPKQAKPNAVKALERSTEVKQGIVAKANPGATPGGQATGGAGNPSEIGAYRALLQRSLQQRSNNAYPQREKMMRRTGIVTLSISISPTGKVINVKVVNSSGNTNLDNAAVKAAESTNLNSPPPVGFPTNLTVPVKFSIQ